MQRQLNRMERDVNKVVEHKSLTESCSKLKDDVNEFIKQYRKDIAELDSRGKEMTETYKKLLVINHSFIYWVIHPLIYLFVH